MNIALVSNFFPPEAIGGAETYVGDLARYLAGRGLGVTVLTGTRGRRRADQFDGVRVLRLARPPPAGPVTSPILGYNFNPWASSVAKTLKKLKPDVVHVHNVHTTLMLAPLVRALPKHVVAHVHDHWPICYRGILYDPNERTSCRALSSSCCFDPGRRLVGGLNLAIRKKLVAELEKKVSTFIAPSQYMIRILREREFSSPEKFQHIPLGVDLDSIQPNPERKPEVVFAGRLIFYKNADLVLRVLPHIKDGLRPRYRIFGSGPETHRLDELARSTGVSSHVHLEGSQPRSEVLTALSRATALVLPSIIPENSPMSVYESLAAGTPALVTDRGGASELLDGGDGVALDPGDLVAWRDQLAGLLANPDRARRMGEAAREHAVRDFSIARSGKAVERVYDAVL